MPAFTVKKSIHIDAPIDRVFESVRNFNEWTAWSPWLIAEPGTTVEQLGPDDLLAGERLGSLVVM